MNMRQRQSLVTAALLALSLLFCLLSFRLSSSAGRLPLFAGALTVVTASLQLISDLRRPAVEREAGEGSGRTSERSVILWTAALIAGVYLAGMSVTLPVFTGLYWRLRDGASWPSAIGAGVCVLGFVQGLLAWLLRIDLHDGMIGRWLRF